MSSSRNDQKDLFYSNRKRFIFFIGKKKIFQRIAWSGAIKKTRIKHSHSARELLAGTIKFFLEAISWQTIFLRRRLRKIVKKNVLITSPRVVWLRLVDVVASRRHRNFQKHKRNDDILFTYGLTVCLSSRWKIGNIFVPSHVFRFRSSLHDVNWSLLKYFCLTKTNIFTFIDHQNDQDDLNTWECHIGK